MAICSPAEQPTSELLAEPKDSQSQVKRMLGTPFLYASGMACQEHLWLGGPQFFLVTEVAR